MNYSQDELIALRKILVERFNLDELRILCHDLGLDYEILSGDTKNRKALELVDYMRRYDRLPELRAAIDAARGQAGRATLPTPSRSPLEIKQEYLEGLHQEYEAAHTQLGRTLDEIDRIRIRRRIEELESEIRQTESELRGLESSYDLPKKSTPNPFGETGRIASLDRFFDREELLRQVFEELGKGVNLSLVGESQVGKSSLLSMICALGPERLGLPSEAFVYLSLQWVENEDDFYAALCDSLGIEVCRGYALIRALRGKRYVVCLDEIEAMAIEDFGFTVRVRSQLRGLADGPQAPLKLVIASRSPLARLFPDSPELDSPLAGICRQVDVGPFPPDVARAFLAHRLQGTGVIFSQSEIARLIKETGGHPARLQRAAADLYDVKRS